MRYLGIDLGQRRTGLAAGDSETGLVTPLKVLAVPAGPALFDALAAAIAEHAPDALVVGLPLNMDDTEGPAAKQARADGAQLAARSGLEVHYQDERLTSDAADAQLAGSGRTRRQKKQIQDALAACLILEEYLRGTTAR